MTSQVFAPFLKSVGASDIRAFEEGQLKDMQEQYKARMKLQQHRSNLEVRNYLLHRGAPRLGSARVQAEDHSSDWVFCIGVVENVRLCKIGRDTFLEW